MMSGSQTESTRERLVETAARLFYEDGIRATSVDRVVEAAGLSKPTLYRHFGSKEALITAVLERRARNREHALDDLLRRGVDPEAGLLGVFDFLDASFREDDFHGCALVNAAVELGDPDGPGRAVTARHKARIRDRLERAAADGGYRDSADLAQALLLLIEGATTMAHAGGEIDAARQAKVVAKRLLDAHRDRG